MNTAKKNKSISAKKNTGECFTFKLKGTCKIQALTGKK